MRIMERSFYISALPVRSHNTEEKTPHKNKKKKNCLRTYLATPHVLSSGGLRHISQDVPNHGMV
jgi:hypothetical protein